MPDTEPKNKPQIVVNALRTLYLHLASGVIVYVLYVHRTAEEYRLWIGDLYVLAFFVFGFWVAFILEIRKGKNWARITFVTLFGLFVSIAIGVTIWLPSHSPFHSFVFYVQTSLGIIACAFLVAPEVSAWFREQTHQRKAGLPLRWPIGSERETMYDLKAVPADEPLLVVQYHGYKQVWRLVLLLLFTAFWGGFVLLGLRSNDEHALVGIIIECGAWLLLLVLIYGLIRTLLVGQIRLYRDRMVQTRKLMSDIEVRLADASYLCSNVPRSFMRVVNIFVGKNTWRSRRRGIIYEENMMAAKDVALLHRVLADLTGRKVSDFEQYRVKLNRLMKTEEEEEDGDNGFSFLTSLTRFFRF
jgi:hypothetical protein